VSLESFSKNFDGGCYTQGKAWRDEDGRGCAPYQYAAAAARAEGLGPDDKTLAARQAHYMEKLKVPEWASWRKRAVKAYAEDTWWLEEYFRHAPKLKHPHMTEEIDLRNDCIDTSPTMEKAFQVVPAELTVFPFFWDTQIVESILAVPLLDVLLMDTVTVASGTAVHAQMNETVSDRQMGETGEFASYQEVNITSVETPVRLKKFGGMVTISDEAMRRQRIPVFARGIARIGRQIGIDMTDLVIEVLINGDTQFGGLNGAATGVNAAVSGSPTYTDYVSNDLNFDIGYEPTDRILTRAGIIKVLGIPEFKDPLAGFKFQNAGVYPEVFGLSTHRWDSTGSSSWSTTTGTGNGMLTVQRQRACLLYQEGGLVTESDRSALSESTIVKSSWYLIPAIWDGLARRFSTGYA
jgi:hypothetical protein